MIKNCYVALCVAPSHYFILKQPIECTSADCFSGIYAIARFFTYRLPNILPPLQNITKEEILSLETKCYKPMIKAWNMHLVNIIENSPSLVHRHRENFYIIVQLENSNLDKIKA